MSKNWLKNNVLIIIPIIISIISLGYSHYSNVKSGEANKIASDALAFSKEQDKEAKSETLSVDLLLPDTNKHDQSPFYENTFLKIAITNIGQKSVTINDYTTKLKIADLNTSLKDDTLYLDPKNKKQLTTPFTIAPEERMTAYININAEVAKQLEYDEKTNFYNASVSDDLVKSMNHQNLTIDLKSTSKKDFPFTLNLNKIYQSDLTLTFSSF